MSSAYEIDGSGDGAAAAGERRMWAVPQYAPRAVILKCGERAAVRSFAGPEDAARAAEMLEHAIVVDRAWPFDAPLEPRAFERYFCAHAAFVLELEGEGAVDTERAAAACPGPPRPRVVGAFYVKPNFPGRCDHVCNGGFVTDPRWRRRGVGEAMARAFLSLAHEMGYRLVLFNLVFANNIASIALWEKLGFTRLATLPGVVRMRKDGNASAAIVPGNAAAAVEYVDAYQYCFSLPYAEEDEDTNRQ